jgi:hypothetical protein
MTSKQQGKWDEAEQEGRRVVKNEKQDANAEERLESVVREGELNTSVKKGTAALNAAK